MRPLTEALALIPAGWSPRYEITDRAVLMREHARAGNAHRAEEYAAEIATIQRAYDEHRTAIYGAWRPRTMPSWAVSEWQLTPGAWAELLIHGWKVQRGIWAAEGWAAANVAGEAHRVWPEHHFTAADVMPPRVAVGRAA